MSFSEFIFVRKNPSAAEISDGIEKTKAEIAADDMRIAEAKAALGRIAYMSDAEHAAAETALPAAERSKRRLEMRLDELANDLVVAQKAEADAALAARRKTVQRRVDVDYPKLLARLEAKMPEVAEIAAALQAIEGEARVLNSELQETRKDSSRKLPDLVETPCERYFTEPETVIAAAQTVTDKKWQYVDDRGYWRDVCVFTERNGQPVPEMAGAELRSFERTIPERRSPARCMSSPTANLYLPATRFDGEPYWPKRS